MGWHSKPKRVGEQTKKRKPEDIKFTQNLCDNTSGNSVIIKKRDIGSCSCDEYQDDLETRYRVLNSATIPYKNTKFGKIYRYIKNISIPILIPPLASTKISEAVPFLSKLRESSSIETNSNPGES